MQTLSIKTETATFQPKEVHIGDYVLQFGTNPKNGKPTLYYGKVKTVGKNKGEIDYYGRYYYNSVQERDASALEKYNNFKSRIETEAKEREQRKAKQQSLNPAELLGKIFYTSWGYDQTNINYYQVIGSTAKMVIVMEVAQETVHSEGYSSMSAMVKPIPNEFIGKETKHLIKYCGDTLTIVNGRHPMWEYQHGEKGMYSSWYA